MRKADFDLNHMINTLNTTTYKIGGTESFTINVFSPWFDADGTQAVGGEQNLDLDVPVGKIPLAYTFPQDSIHAINFEFTGTSPTEGGITGGSAEIEDIVAQTDTTIRLKLNDDFNAGNGERVALAVKPTGVQQVSQNGDLIVDENARSIFPKFAGAFNIRRNDYYYEELIDEGGTVRLRNISVPTESQNNLSVDSSDYVIMSPRNYLVVPTGTSDGTVYGGDYLFGKGIYDASLIRPGSRKPDITADDLTSNLSEQESAGTFFSVNEDLDELYIGGGGTGQFGSAFFNADMSIGGEQKYCDQGACNFALGVRAFFLLEFINQKQGDGITFTLTNWETNSETSVGGDFQLSELMGYAGDSRLDAAGNTFLASNEDDRGLEPPKIAVEFDTRTSSRIDDPPPDYCIDANTINDLTRNDPLPDGTDVTDNKDAVQYVFWGRTNFLNIPCRDNPPPSPPLYDDNRHDADGEEATEEWRFGTSGLVASSPAIGPDGTIYVVSDGKLYAINPDGLQKWVFTDKILSFSPVYDDNDTPADTTDDTIYAVGSGDGNLHAIRTDNVLKWSFDAGGDLDSSPFVGPDHTIYAGRDHNSAADPGQVIAVNPDGTPKGLNWPFQVPTAVENDIDAQPVVDDNGTPGDTTDDTIYVGSEDRFFYAINPNGTFKWSFDTGYVVTAAAIADDGTVYAASRDSKVYAINPDGTSKGLSWPFDTGGVIVSSPAIEPNDGTIYIGSDDGHLYAINPNGTEKWRFPGSGSIAAVQSSPLIDLDGTVYFGSNDGNVYAVNPNGTEKWQFLIGLPVKSSPSIGKTGFIHVGSDDTNVYTLSQYADPRNFKLQFINNERALLTNEDLNVGPGDLDDPNDWLNGKSGVKGPWAVRLEVDRSILPNPDGNFDYQLSLWIRQCQELDCSDINGTFFSDTRIDYENAPATTNLPMIQNFDLKGGPGEDHDKFTRFYFGFTGAAGAEALNATISQFNLSFIRAGDPDVDVALGDDPDWLP
jgi:outer membrane protein assembly factor BamB